MGYPVEYFTVLFALGRLPGWIAQWEEMLNDPEQKIARPEAALRRWARSCATSCPSTSAESTS